MKTNNTKNPRDGFNTSLWQSQEILTNETTNPVQETVYDVLIVGAGITGLTTALLLQKEGKKCVIAEANTIGFGTTGGTSAHLNTFFDTTYPQVKKDFGEEAMKLLAQAGKDALNTIKNFKNSLSIDCDYQEKPAILYAENKKQAEELQQIKQETAHAGIMVKAINYNSLPIDFEQALLLDGQGQFHPLKYLNGLVNEFLRLGGVIKENALVLDNTYQDDVYRINIKDKEDIKARKLVYATHVPPGLNIFNLECAPYRSYVMAIKLNDEAYPNELIYDMQEPYHYFRTHQIDGQNFLLIGGEDHKTGHDNPEEAFGRLRAYIKKYFAVAEIAYQWSSQYYIPVDGLPYIGHYPGKENAYLATGFQGNGMMFGTLSGRIMADQILGIKNPYEKLFSPSRIKPMAGFKDFMKENADVALHFVKDRFTLEEMNSFEDISPDSGKVVDFKGDKVAVYKDSLNKLHFHSPVCTHTGCIVNWNGTEKSWDCPCHGGRFDAYGKVLTGPPQKDLNALFKDQDKYNYD